LKIKPYGKEFLAESGIVATGASPVKLKVPGEDELLGKGVSYCATCDGWFFRDKKVAVIGGGDSALEEALFLTRYASEIVIIHRRDEFRAGALLQKRMRENEKIKLHLDSVVKEISGEGKVETLLLENVKNGEQSTLNVDGVFIFIGHTPNNDFYRGQLDMDEHGYIKVDDKMRTSVEGVFAAGEAADAQFKQVVVSAGMGAAAAIQAGRYLAE
jgi:thioredoxin reductase (NADPH)